jgi:Flp pilus assembly protein TadD
MSQHCQSMGQNCRRTILGILLAGVAVLPAHARDFRLKIPKKSWSTPAQQLNREGVEAVLKNQFDKAKALFYKAYVMDPGDPFTLNNLGYIAELEGQQDRAQAFYGLAGGQATDANIERASTASLRGRSLQSALGGVQDLAIRINRANVEAVRLLSQDRAWQADSLLQATLTLAPKNGFTLNNLGVTKEAEGEYAEALKYYAAATDSHSTETVVVSMDPAWRGKPVATVAAESAKRLRKRMGQLQTPEAQTALLNMRGVAALNRNDWVRAQQNFAQAYSISPANAFSLNNQAVVAEMNGDLETAQEFYRDAETAPGSRARVGLATRPGFEGFRLESVANGSEANVSGAIETAGSARHRESAPVVLKHRDGTPVIEPSSSSPSAPPSLP